MRTADADVCFSLIHIDNIYNSANPELKTVNLEPAQATRECLMGFTEPLSSDRERTHVGEAEALRVLSSVPPGEKGAWTRSDSCLGRPQRNSSLYSSGAPRTALHDGFKGMRAWRRQRPAKTRPVNGRRKTCVRLVLVKQEFPLNHSRSSSVFHLYVSQI